MTAKRVQAAAWFGEEEEATEAAAAAAAILDAFLPSHFTVSFPALRDILSQFNGENLLFGSRNCSTLSIYLLGI